MWGEPRAWETDVGLQANGSQRVAPGPAALALMQTCQDASSWSIPDLLNQKLWGQAQWSVFLGAIQVILIHNNTKVWELYYSRYGP